MDDQRAIERYRYMLRTAPPDDIERAHAEAFARLTPEQRRVVLNELSAQVPPAEAPRGDDLQSLARAATRAEMRQPGTLERTFSNMPGPGMAPGISMGGLMAGSFLSSIAGVFIGTAIANTFFADHGYNEGYTEGYQDAEAQDAAGQEGATDGDNAGADYSGGADYADYGGGDVAGDMGGDFGGGDFGGDF